MKNTLPLRRPFRKNRPLTSLRLEMLEDRTMLDAGPVLHYPQAILRPDFGIPGNAGAAAPSSGHQGAGSRTPPNVLVNDPAEDGSSPNDYH